MNQLWELLEKEIGVVFLGDLKVVPKKDSQDPIETMLWNARNRGTLLIDTSIENTGGSVQFNQFSRLDLSRSAEIQVRIQLAQQLRAEAYQLIGITPQRLGAAQASEAATVNNNALQQSFAQTETWFAWHESVLQKVYQTILEMAQYIEIQKPTSTLNYLNTELENVFLKVTKNELLHELFVFVSSYAEDKQTLDQLKQLAQPAMQNGAEMSEMLDLFTADSERSLRKTLSDVQKRKQAIMEQQNAMKQQEMEQSQKQFEMKIQIDDQRRQQDAAREDMNKELDRQNRLEVEKLKGIANEGSFNPELDLTDKLIQQTKLSQDASTKNFEQAMKNKEMSLKEKELMLKNKDIDTKLKIAKENRNKFDGKKK
jgi:hypothetical protein